MTAHEARPRADSGPTHAGGRSHLREVEWMTASVLIFSSDGHLLMGQKHPSAKRVRLNAWHLPGGEVEAGESLAGAAIRRIEQEVGLRLAPEQLATVPFIGEDETVRTLVSGETAWCRIKLNRFEVHLDKTAAQLKTEVRAGDDLMTLRFFSPAELADVEQMPGTREFFIRAGYIKANKR